MTKAPKKLVTFDCASTEEGVFSNGFFSHHLRMEEVVLGLKHGREHWQYEINPLLRTFPQLVLTENDWELALAHAKTGRWLIHEAVEKLILLPDWRAIAGSYQDALRSFQLSQNRNDALLDSFTGLREEDIAQLTTHKAVSERLLNNEKSFRIGNFFVVGCAFRLWRAGQKGSDVLAHLLQTEVPAGLLDSCYIKYTEGSVPDHIARFGMGALGDVVLNEEGEVKLGGVFVDSPGQVTCTDFILKPIDYHLRCYMSLFVPEFWRHSWL